MKEIFIRTDSEVVNYSALVNNTTRFSMGTQEKIGY